MRKLIGIVGIFLAAVLATNAFAQPAEPYERRRFGQMELDQMLAPIALYPDALLSQVLMAATYPQDVYEAASWSRVNDVRGEQAVRAVEGERWDPSVISLAAFPQVLQMMDERREWTERLGEAFLAQPENVMDTVQELRRRAYEAGNLRTTEEIVVQRSGNDFVIEPPSPEVVYVPYYDPRVVYGDWWWPGYEPVYWSPWRGYAYTPGWVGFGWGPSVFVGSSFFFGGFDWRHRYVRYSHHRPWYWRGHDYRQGYRWRHDPARRWRDRDRDGVPNWRDRDRNNDGRIDRRWRDRDGDGRPNWRDRDRDGDGRPNWRDRDRDNDGRPDGRWRDRDGDGRRDGRDGRGGRGGAPSGGAVAPPTQHGFFRPSPATPTAPAPSSRGEPVRERFVREQPGQPASHPMARQPAQRPVPVPAAQPRVAAPVQVPAPQRVTPPPQRAMPAPQPRAMPAPAPAPAPAASHGMSRPQPAERPAPPDRSADGPRGGFQRGRER